MRCGQCARPVQELVRSTGGVEVARILLCSKCDYPALSTMTMTGDRHPRRDAEPVDPNDQGRRRLFFEIDDIIRSIQGESDTRSLISDWAIEGKTFYVICKDGYSAGMLKSHPPHFQVLQHAVWEVFGPIDIEIGVHTDAAEMGSYAVHEDL